MNREDVSKLLLTNNLPQVLLELPTSFGKTKMALEWLYEKIYKINPRAITLIVIPRLVLEENWRAELDKWGYHNMRENIVFTTYVSLPKRLKENHIVYDAIIFDEAHHLSDRCVMSLLDCQMKIPMIFLSATMKKELKEDLIRMYRPKVIKVNIKSAINDGILPDPKVILIPLELNRIDKTCEVIKNPKLTSYITIDWKDRHKFKGVKNKKVIIKCTQKEFYDDISSTVEYYKNRNYSQRERNLWLSYAGKRLKWLSDQKTTLCSKILSALENERTLTFCNSIKQTELLGANPIHSQNKKSEENIEKFNNGEINHITSVNMLNEGINLSGCKIGLYASLNSSEIMVKQKLGRILRHKEPIIIIPYYKNTRDEEIKDRMLKDYNPELVNYAYNMQQVLKLTKS